MFYYIFSASIIYQNPVSDLLINVGAKVADKSSQIISKIGSKVQEKLDSSGVTDKYRHIVDTTVDTIAY